MGVDPGVFSPAHRDLRMRKGLLELCELPEDATLLIGVGRFAPEKRWPMLVDAVTAAGTRRPVGLVLAGQGRDHKNIERRIAGNPHIRILAPITDRQELARVMASADALVHGCEAETFCMVAAEACASGLPLIAPDEGGAADQARASAGWIYESANAAAAAETIVEYCIARESGLDGPRADIPPPRVMDDHFAELFASYEQLVRDNRSKPGPRRAA
jgi:alpha-1,6-mannosyltransferase